MKTNPDLKPAIASVTTDLRWWFHHRHETWRPMAHGYVRACIAAIRILRAAEVGK